MLPKPKGVPPSPEFLVARRNGNGGRHARPCSASPAKPSANMQSALFPAEVAPFPKETVLSLTLSRETRGSTTSDPPSTHGNRSPLGNSLEDESRCPQRSSYERLNRTDAKPKIKQGPDKLDIYPNYGARFADDFDLEKSWCLIIPHEGSWKVKWDLMMLVLILYSTIMVPVRVCFPNAQAEGGMWVFELALSLFFLADCFFSFRLSYLKNGQWVTDSREIARAYLGGWFWIDAPSSLPLELLDLVPGQDASQYALLRFLRMFRLMRLLKLLKLNDLLEQIEDSFETSLRGFKLVFEVGKMMFFAHTLGCFWFGAAIVAQTPLFGGSEDTPTWFTEYWILHAQFHADEGEVPTTSQYYQWSLYWALTTLTTVGYGDIVPRNDVERWYASVGVLLGGFVFGLMLSNVGVLVASLDRQAAIIEAKIDSVKEYAFTRELPAELSGRLKRHFKYYYTRKTAFDEQTLLAECPQQLRTEVECFVMRNTLGRVPLMERLDPDFRSDIFPHIKPVTFASGETIFQKGETSRDLLFLVFGEVNIMSAILPNVIEKRLTPNQEIFVAAHANDHADEPMVVIESNGVMGEEVLRGSRRNTSYVAHTDCHTLSLARSDLVIVFEKNPRAAWRIVHDMLGAAIRKERLRSLTRKMLLGVASHDSMLWAALKVQDAWARYVKEHLTVPLHLPEIDKTPAEVKLEEQEEHARLESLQAVEHAGFKVSDSFKVPESSATDQPALLPPGSPFANSPTVPPKSPLPSMAANPTIVPSSLEARVQEIEERILASVTSTVRAEFAQLRVSLQGGNALRI